jgi:hypothetical protein
MTAYRALELEFVVHVDEPALRDHVADVFQSLAVDDARAEHLEQIRVTAAPDLDGLARFDVVHDDVTLGSGLTAPAVVDAIVQRINVRCIESDGWLSTHASAVARDGDAVLFAAHSESGKSTLAAGLVRAGYAYVTDEAVALDWQHGCIQPYPKPISLDPGSWPLFPEAEPELERGADASDASDAAFAQWQVPPGRLGPGRVSGPCRPRWVVFPEYVAGAPTTLTPIARGEALVEWAKNTFRFNQHGRRALELLGALVPDVDCYRMTVGDLDHAVARVRELVGA